MSVSHSPRVRARAGHVNRRRRRPWFAKPQVAKWLLRGLVVTVALMLGYLVAGKILRPIALVANEKSEQAKVVSRYLALKQQNRDLTRQLHYLQTPDGIAQEARKQGFVKPGEVSIVLPDDSQAPKPKR